MVGGGVESGWRLRSHRGRRLVAVAADENAYRLSVFDDTNPTKEEQEYIDAIEKDVRWMGFSWGKHLYHASDYFEQLYAWAEHLIQASKAYVDDLSADEIRAHRGTLTEPGQESPYRNRAVDENLDLFRRMRKGEFPNGARVLRAKIDMASGNINLRDPVLYRILHAAHPRTGDAWCVYPTYDYAHGQSDAIEHITHSLCTLEFEDHRGGSPTRSLQIIELGRLWAPRLRPDLFRGLLLAPVVRDDAAGRPGHLVAGQVLRCDRQAIDP